MHCWNKQTWFVMKFCGILYKNTSQKSQKGPKMVPKKSHFCPKGPNFAFVVTFWGKSQIPNPVLQRLRIFWQNSVQKIIKLSFFLTNSIQIFIHLSVFDKIQFKYSLIFSFSTKFNSKFDSFVKFSTNSIQNLIHLSISRQNSIKKCIQNFEIGSIQFDKIFIQ